MSIIDLEQTKDHIIKWLQDYTKNAGTKTFIVGLSGGIDSALTALLCKQTHIPTICVALPCHSSESSLKRATAFAKDFELDLITINLTNANDSILQQIHNISTLPTALTTIGMNNPVAIGGLRSCLRTPALSYLSLSTNGLIVGTGNRSEDHLIRYFQKFGDGCVDICPISDLFKNEVYALFAHITRLNFFNDGNTQSILGPQSAIDIYNATPTADLWDIEEQTDEKELGLSYDEIEWADRQDMQNGIIISADDPTRHRAWIGYTVRQREVIAKMHQMEKSSRHKYNSTLPICELRNIKSLVR